MKLTDQEKEWVKEINNNNALDYFDLLETTKYYNEEKRRFVVPIEEQREFEVLIYKCESLLTKLSANNLIHLSVDRTEASHGILVYEEVDGELISESYFNELLPKFLVYTIIKQPELDSYIANDYKTKDELRLEDEISDRKFAQRIAIIIGILSIISAVIAPFIDYLLTSCE